MARLREEDLHLALDGGDRFCLAVRTTRQREACVRGLAAFTGSVGRSVHKFPDWNGERVIRRGRRSAEIFCRAAGVISKDLRQPCRGGFLEVISKIKALNPGFIAGSPTGRLQGPPPRNPRAIKAVFRAANACKVLFHKDHVSMDLCVDGAQAAAKVYSLGLYTPAGAADAASKNSSLEAFKEGAGLFEKMMAHEAAHSRTG